ncbi:MAG TPA: bifunctional tetrahydrofolate synthase/dihydrofolate synthase [Burkholderiales bacterium]|nr:bifunctional tetrahydrofolate synthase/dihydrofolate synthase [Burkholderiales bacterium]
MTRRTLAAWLEYIEQQHPSAIALGLERVAQVLGKLDVRLACPVLTVGGTNGKGSVCAMLASILGCAGYRVGLYTSPHLLRYNERVRIDGREADDDALCEAFEAVEQVRGEVPLTYFEFGTLAAAWLFAREALDATILEVGLGGRLDAVNALEPDCAVLTSIGVDHVEFLGGTREAIGREKAGIFRAAKPAVVADPDPPASVLECASTLGARLLLLGKDFGYVARAAQWSYWGPAGKRHNLAHPALRGAMQLRNASAALTALDALGGQLPIGMRDVRQGLAAVRLAGRFQVLPGRPQVILDVAHNPQAAQTLADNLADSGYAQETIAVVGMLRDKDIAGVLRAVSAQITRWHAATLGSARGASADEIAAALERSGLVANVTRHESVARALDAARNEAKPDDKIVVFGSFLTVAAAMTYFDPHNNG